MNPPPADPENPGRLREIQRAFATGILRPLSKDGGMQREWIDGRSTEEAVGGFIKPNDRLSSFERLQIYNRQYWYRLLDCFYEDFPGLRTLMGDRGFMALAQAYLTKYRSNSFTLRDLGSRLGQYLGEEPQWTEAHPILSRDIVRLEWAHIVAFDGEALPPVEVDELLGQDPATLTLALQPYLTLLACDYPVDGYVLAVRRRDEPQGKSSNAMAERMKKVASKKVPRPKPRKTWLAVHRSNNGVYYKTLEPAAYTLLTRLREGASLQAACEETVREHRVGEEFAAMLKDWFTQWSSFGWFCRREENPGK